jgi:hypothetical protein
MLRSRNFRKVVAGRHGADSTDRGQLSGQRGAVADANGYRTLG